MKGKRNRIEMSVDGNRATYIMTKDSTRKYKH